MKNIPKKIYLNDDDMEFTFPTVSFDREDNFQIEYILATPALKAAQARSQWIKIESESDLPTEHGEYIVRLKSGKVKGAAYYSESKRFYTGGNVNDNPVTHWMNLPQPPKED